MAKSIDWESRIGRRLRLRDLHILSAVAQSGSMAKAAAHLHVTQPAVSKAIGDLEAAVGARLLDRSPQGVEPTVYGHALLKCGLVVFDELRQGIRDIEHLSDPAAGELRIGCQATLAATMLPPIIEQLSHLYPRLDFHVTQLVSPTFEFPELRHRTIDLMLALLPGPLVANKLGDDVSVEIIFDARAFVVAGLQSRWTCRRKIELTELADEPWLLAPPGSWSWSLVAEAFVAKKLGMPRVKVASYSVPLLYSLCATGKFIGVLDGLELRINGRHLGIKALPIDLPVWPWPIGIVMLKNRTVSPVVKLFIEHVRTFTASLGAARDAEESRDYRS
jgi:DNA-binding transcriptional LysR family regulator